MTAKICERFNSEYFHDAILTRLEIIRRKAKEGDKDVTWEDVCLELEVVTEFVPLPMSPEGVQRYEFKYERVILSFERCLAIKTSLILGWMPYGWETVKEASCRETSDLLDQLREDLHSFGLGLDEYFHFRFEMNGDTGDINIVANEFILRKNQRRNLGVSP